VRDRHAAELEANRLAWNTRTPVHVRSSFYDVDGFLAGACSLPAIDVEAVGDVAGRSLLHLQCHFGMDTLSFARRGARVVGLDFSDVAIAEARRLAERAGLSGRFVCADVHDAPAAVEERFDKVYVSYGAIPWLPDLRPWARAVADCLVPGGTLHLHEFHPVLSMLADDELTLAYPWDSAGAGIATTESGTYADRDAPIRVHDVTWNHGLGSILGAILEAGLRIRAFAEHFYSPYPLFRDGIEIARGRWQMSRYEGRMPYVFTLCAER
jgi:SAM-dependent methyltransferase